MKQMHIDPDKVVSVELQGAAEILKPVVFSEGNAYCCLLGPDPQTGVMGCGSSPEQAVDDWNNRLKEHLATPADDDEVVKYVHDIVNPPTDINALRAKYGLRPVDKTKKRL